ncbi:hypothetical protein BMF94_6595 [Rhodotorula taiwanensis]|uniref:Major facilitator superfamily (MFS) profile domain-containing protein n=1 Tax=Rhodotorula taiwanensis TaxID=741276 RepID=A0A2S5B0N3_9BASI|nr:hypothetical protein BMF94_6595 [Rhodotorula taiwanensis]
MTASAQRSEPYSPTTTIHTLVDEPYLDRAGPATRSRSIMGDSDLVKTTSRHSHLSVVDPEELAVEKAPQDVIWVEWDGPNDPANPLNWSRRRKWLISWVGIGFCALVSFSVSGYSIAVASVQETYGCSKEVALLGITLFTVTFGAAPLLLAPLSEVYGRSYIYFISAVVFFLCFLPQALGHSMALVLVFRFISGIAGSTAVSLVGGTLADVWRDEDRGTPMALFSFAAFGSTGLGPVAFGYLAQIKGFHYVSWALFAMSGAFTVVMPFVLDETRGSVLLSRKAAKLRKSTGDDRYQSKGDIERGSLSEMFKTSLSRPVRMLLTEPVLLAITLWISFTWAVLYLFLVSIPYVYGRIFNFNTGEAGLVYITQFLGSCIGMAYDKYCARLYRANVDKRGPEARLYTAFGGGVCVPIGAFIFCFTSYKSVHWMGSCIGVVILYIGMFCTYLTAFNYLGDAYALYASSALSAMSFVRNVVGAVFPLFTQQMYDRLGVQGATGLTAGLGTLLASTPFIIFMYGAKLRARSPFAKELAKREAEDRARREAPSSSRESSRTRGDIPVTTEKNKEEA